MENTSKLQIIKLYDSLARDILKIYILLTHLFLVIQVISFKRKGIGFSWVKAARGGSLEIYNTLDLCSNHKIDYHERSHSWYAQDFYQANQLEIKLKKNST